MAEPAAWPGESAVAGRRSPGRRYLPRFGRTERALHWLHAAGFLVMLGSGLVLTLPALGEAIGRRPLVKDVHLLTAIAWAGALLLVVLLGDRRALRRAAREIDRFDRDDRRWLSGGGAPQGRLNAGQKLNAVLSAAFAVLLAASGLLLWMGERDHTFQLDGAGAVHEALTWASLLLFLGHLYLAVIHPRTRHALRGITVGTVEEGWAREHHEKWATAAVEGNDHTRGCDGEGCDPGTARAP